MRPSQVAEGATLPFGIVKIFPNGSAVPASRRPVSAQAVRWRTAPTSRPTLRKWLPAAIWVTP
jgi:hypothetical protein